MSLHDQQNIGNLAIGVRALITRVLAKDQGDELSLTDAEKANVASLPMLIANLAIDLNRIADAQERIATAIEKQAKTALVLGR